MASWSTPPIHATGDILAVTDANTWSNDLTFLYQAPYINAYDSAGTSMPDSVTTTISLGTILASGYGFSISANNVIVPLAGTYWCSGAVTVVSNSGQVVANVFQNGAAISQSSSNASANGISACSSTLAHCASSTALAVVGSQNSGSTVSSTPGQQYTYLSVAFIGSL